MRMRVTLAAVILLQAVLPFLADAAITAEEVAYIRTHPDATVAEVTAAMKPRNRTTDRQSCTLIDSLMPSNYSCA